MLYRYSLPIVELWVSLQLIASAIVIGLKTTFALMVLKIA